MEPTKLAVYVETGETGQSAAQEVHDVLGTYLPAGVTLVEVTTAAEEEHHHRQQPPAPPTPGTAPGTQDGAQPADSTAAHGINLAAQFRLDEDAARDLIQRVIAARDDDDIPADDTPEFGATWHPCDYDSGSTVHQLVRYAADNGAIVRPEHMDLDFVHVSGDEEGTPDYYYFTADIGRSFDQQVTVSSVWTEMRKLVDDETGADAAMSILGEAVARANRELDRLAALFASHAAVTAAAA